MTWSIEFLEEAERDMKKLDHFAQIQMLKGIRKVSKNPLSTEEGGYGKPLGNKSGINLTNLMKIIVVSARTDEQVYKEAAKRRDKHDL